MPAVSDATLLKIDNQSVPGLKSYKVTHAKLWRDAERNMAGDIRATLIGIYPKLELEFGGELLEDDISSIVAKLDQPYFGVTYFDPKSKTTKTAQYYAGDYSVELDEKTKGRYKPFQVNLIPVSRSS